MQKNYFLSFTSTIFHVLPQHYNHYCTYHYYYYYLWLSLQHSYHQCSANYYEYHYSIHFLHLIGFIVISMTVKDVALRSSVTSNNVSMYHRPEMSRLDHKIEYDDVIVHCHLYCCYFYYHSYYYYLYYYLTCYYCYYCRYHYFAPVITRMQKSYLYFDYYCYIS